MNSYIQLASLVLSFIYGVILYYLNKFNIKIIKGKNIILKSIICLLYTFDISLLYVVILYNLNNGILHIYFVLCILFGYGIVCVKKCQ